MGREKKAEPEGKQYLYKDEEMRLKRSNRLVFIATVVECIDISLYLILRMMWKETDRPMLPQIANWITILALTINIVVYKVKKIFHCIWLVYCLSCNHSSCGIYHVVPSR